MIFYEKLKLFDFRVIPHLQNGVLEKIREYTLALT